MEQEINYNAIGKRIRQYRLLKHLTQENISNATDLAASYISNIENGSTKVGLGALVRIARALEVSMDQLLYDNMPVLVANYDADAKEVLADCSDKERLFLLQSMKSLKQLMRTNNLK
ncbi:MAG: helix-turn-helix domain-containing protein [Erysipelotrichaceae bacterium]